MARYCCNPTNYIHYFIVSYSDNIQESTCFYQTDCARLNNYTHRYIGEFNF